MATSTAFSTWQYRDAAAPLARIARLRRLAWVIDALGRVPGTRFRFGLNSVIGLAPWAGDAVLVLISLYIVFEAVRLGLPRAKIVRMLLNVAVEAALGAVPILGDLLDVAWKANLRNVDIIDAHFGMVPSPVISTAENPAEGAHALGTSRADAALREARIADHRRGAALGRTAEISDDPGAAADHSAAAAVPDWPSAARRRSKRSRAASNWSR